MLWVVVFLKELPPDFILSFLDDLAHFVIQSVKSDIVKIDLANDTEGGVDSIDQLKKYCFYNDAPANTYCAKSTNLKIPYRHLAIFVNDKGLIAADCLEINCDLARCPLADFFHSFTATLLIQLRKLVQ